MATTFPGERAEAYYVPFSSINGITINASGKLWYHYNYTKGVMKKNLLLENGLTLDESSPVDGECSFLNSRIEILNIVYVTSS